MTIRNPFLSLPPELITQIIYRLDVPGLQALAGTYQNANGAINPWSYVCMKARDHKKGLPEVSEGLKPRLDEMVVVLRVGKLRQIPNRHSNPEFRRVMQPVVKQLNELPPLSALQLVASFCELLDDYRVNTRDHFDRTRRKYVRYGLAPATELIKALPILQALQTISDCYGVFYRLSGKAWTLCEVLQPVFERLSKDTAKEVDWNARMEVLAALLHQIAQEIRGADQRGKFASELIITFPVSKAILALLQDLGESKVLVDPSKVQLLIGELVRTWIQGFKRGWSSSDARSRLEQPILQTGLVSNSEWEQIFRMASSHCHESISFKSIREANDLQPASTPQAENSRSNSASASNEDMSSNRHSKEKCIVC